jgi:Berberine and berberine like
MFGLTCDRLTATSLVLADGRVVEASEDSHPDLFAQQIVQDTVSNKRFHCRLGIGTQGRTSGQIHANANVNVIGQHYGSAEELRAILAPLLAIAPARRSARLPSGCSTGRAAETRTETGSRCSPLAARSTRYRQKRPRSYQNFPDPTLKDWRRAYYGENYHRLVRVKRKYDPAGFFSYPRLGSCRPRTAP